MSCLKVDGLAQRERNRCATIDGGAINLLPKNLHTGFVQAVSYRVSQPKLCETSVLIDYIGKLCFDIDARSHDRSSGRFRLGCLD
jgi:hypothetical protein